MEQAFFELLPRNRFAKFYTDELLKTDLQSRMEIYEVQRNIGVRTANEIRRELDMEALSQVGDEELPLTTMNAMGTRAGVIPKSFMKAVVLEMDVATDRLIKLEKTLVNQAVQVPVGGAAGGAGGAGGAAGGGGGKFGGPQASPQATAGAGAQKMRTVIQPTPIGQPPAMLPVAQDPVSFLASLISVQRNASLPVEIRNEAASLWNSIQQRAANIRAHEGPDEDVPLTDLLAPHVAARPDLEDRINDDKTRGHL
jgi:hypothetical protein